jgi:hypothetical protein
VLEGKSTRHRDVLLSGLNQWRMAWDAQTITGFDLIWVCKEGDRDSQSPPVLFDPESDPLRGRHRRPRSEQVKRLQQALG